MIKVKVRIVRTVKTILDKGELKLRLPEGSNLDDLLFSLISTYGQELSPHLINADVRGVIQKASITRIMINGRDIEFLDGLGTVLHEGDEVLILPIVSDI